MFFFIGIEHFFVSDGVIALSNVDDEQALCGLFDKDVIFLLSGFTR